MQQEERKEIVKSQAVSALITAAQSLFFNVDKFEHAQRVAKMLMASTIVPEHFRNNIGNCIIALNYAERIQADPFMVMQNLYVVHGRPGIEGKLVIALVNQCGRFTPLEYDEKPDSCTAYATEIRSNKELRGPVVDMKLVRSERWDEKQGSKWKTMPQIMFRYRAATFFARTYCPEVLLGMQTVEEINDVVNLQRTSNGKYEAPELPPEPLDTSAFAELINQNIHSDHELSFVDKYIKLSAKATGKTEDEIKVMFAADFDDSLKNFREWLLKQKSAAPAEDGKNENKLSAVTETATSQGPPPAKPKPSGEWDPVTADYMERYKGDKPKILIEACKAAGIEYAGKTPREMHQALKESVKKPDQTIPETDKPEIPTDLFDGLEPEEKLAKCEKIHARIKTIAPALIEQTVNETGMTWDEVKVDADMAVEFILYCLSCYKGDVKTLIPNGN